MFRSSFTLPRKAFKDMWFLFDFYLVTMMVAETWIVPMFVLIMDDSTFDTFGGFFQLCGEDMFFPYPPRTWERVLTDLMFSYDMN